MTLGNGWRGAPWKEWDLSEHLGRSGGLNTFRIWSKCSRFFHHAPDEMDENEDRMQHAGAKAWFAPPLDQ